MKYKSKYIKLILEYCKDKWGKSRYHDDYPRLVIHRINRKEGEDDWDVMGYFNEIENCIHVYPRHHENYLDICDTIIHEYTHYMQNITGMYMKYYKDYTYNYNNHPYEKVANSRAIRYKEECYNKIWSNEK